MKRIISATLAVTLIAGAVVLSGGGNAGKANLGDLQIDVEGRNPWTNLRLNNGPETFHFVVVSDRTGGHRPRIFSQAMDQINLMGPAFVVSVGDLIEGYTKDKAILAEQWKEFQGYVHRLQMPFFYVTGNHDVANAVETKEWAERFGRRYYHFLYRDVLFLMLSSDDPNEAEAGGKFSPEQIEYVKKTLEQNAGVRWTMIFLHKPMWDSPKLDTNGWLDVEKALGKRPATVFCGHEHVYRKFVRDGRNFYQLATTGGISKMRGMDYREFDHIVWVTMQKEGPVLANLMLNGIYPEDLKPPISAEDGFTYYNRKPAVRVTGQVLLAGSPVPGALVQFHTVDAVSKKSRRIADALTRSDGSFAMSSYNAFDGAPAGEYVVTVTRSVPTFDAAGQPGPNQLPEKYLKPETSTLKATVSSTDPNNVNLNLER